MAEFYFAVGSDPRDVFIVIGDNWVHYKRCETEEIAKALVIGQNESRRDDNICPVVDVTGVCRFEERNKTNAKNDEAGHRD